MHKSFVINVVARIFLFSSAAMLFPLAWAWADNPHSREARAFEAAIFLGVLLGGILIKTFSLAKIDLNRINAKDTLAIVGLSWITLSAFGALPLYFSGVVGSYTDAFFEITSGFTTTGASIFVDVEALPRGVLFWRSLTQWLGGMGIIVLYIALLPTIGASTYQLYKAEASGLTVERIEPRLKDTAKSLWGIYFLLSFAETVLLRAGGMTWFDALCHTFATMASGGFSTRNASVAAFNPFLQWVIVVFMFLTGVSFVLHYELLRGRPKVIWKNEELRAYVGLISLMVLIFGVVLWSRGESASPFREAVFNVVSISTTTGFATADFDLWPNALRFCLVVLMFIGGCGGSTSGGMKVIRFVLLIKTAIRSGTQAIFPNLVSPIRFNGAPLPEKVVMAVLTFFAIFMGLMGIGTATLAVTEGCDLVTALTACLTSFSNVGPGLKMVGPSQNFAWISSPGKWCLTFLMLAGRLEIYAILVLFLPATWRK
jgi:trk system potassium uptake protein TrkH